MEVLQKKIFASLEANDVFKANTDMALLCSMLTEENLSTQSIESYISMFCTKGAGVFTYINILCRDKDFENFQSIISCLNTIYILFNNFPKSMTEYTTNTIRLCETLILKYPKYKYNAAKLIQLLTASKDIELDETEVIYIYSNLKRWISDTNANSSMLAIYIQIMGALSGNKFMAAKLQEIANIILNIISTIANQKSGEQNLLQGGYSAAQDFMKHSEFNSQQVLLLYSYVMRDMKLKSNKRQGSRTVLEFIACNADVFAAQIQNDIDVWESDLQQWFKSASKDDSKAGYNALIAVYKAVGIVWAQANEMPVKYLPILRRAQKILEKNDNSYEAKLSLNTIGYVAAAASKFMNEKDYHDLFIFLLQKIEYLMSDNSKINENILTANSCDCVEAISPFLESLHNNLHVYMNQFKRIVILLIKMFPYILPNKQETVIQTIRRMFASISNTKVELFLDFVKDVVKQGVIWTCSHSLAQEVEIFDLDLITYKRYLPLWLGLLHLGENTQFDAIHQALWDRLIKNLIYMSDKLNLTITEIEANNGMFDHLRAEKHNDLIVFANLSDFYCDLFNNADPDLLKPWLDLLCDHLIRKSTQLPLISGFYKLLATLMKMFEDIHYFHSRRVERKEHVFVTFENVNVYLKHVLKQVLRVKNDLQMACALFILRMPIEVVTRLHYDFSKVFIIAFKLGQYDYRLANIAVDTLAKWHQQLNSDDSWPLLRQVVPVLDVYLRNQFVFGDSIYVQGRKVKKYAQKKLDVDEEPELIQLQLKILKFLATLPNEIYLELNNASAEMKLNKGDSKLLKVNLLIGERSLSLWLDPFLDRVLLLSVESTDRKVRIPACELLHSIVAVFLGTSAQSSITDFEHQLEKILTAMLSLACDQDTIVVSLFNPLLLQMAHWYAHPKHSNSTLAHIFINSLMDGASNGNNAAVRDLSGTVLREFVAWTCKQNTRDTLKHNLNNIKLMVDHMNQFSLHPDEVRRFGAAVIFNNIYRELREEDAIVDAFWLEILYSFVMNLNLVQPAASDENQLKEIHLALDRVTRCLLQKCSLFKRVDGQRSTPPKFKGNTFDDAALFLLQQTYQLNICCRRKCMEIFKRLPSETMLRALESFDITCYLHDLHTTPFFNDIKSTEQVLTYFASLTCLIDGHVFIMQINPSSELASSVLWSILDKLIDGEFKKKNMKYLRSMFATNNDALVRRIKDEFGYFRARFVETLLGLYTVLLENGMNADNIFSDKLGDFLADYMFDYHSLGLMHLSHETWKEYASNLLELLFKSLKINSSIFDMLRLHSHKALSEIEQKVEHLNIHSEVEWSQRQKLKGLAVLRHTDSNNLLALESPNDSLSLKTLYSLLGLDKMECDDILTIPKLKDSQREYFTLRLESMLDEEFNPNYEQDFECVLAALCMDRPVYSLESLSTLPQGVLWFLMFKKTILNHTVNPNRLYRTLVHLFNECRIDLRIKYFKEFLKYVYNTPVVKGNCDIQQELVKSLEYIWPTSQAKSECLEVLDSNICLELICDLRLVVNRITCETMLETVVAILETAQPSDIQQLDHFTRVTRVLGMVAPRGFSLDIQNCFDSIHSKLRYFEGESKRAATNLFLKTLFEATYYSFCLNFFTNALHFYVMLQNDIEVNAKFCESVMIKMPTDLQGVLINEIFMMRKNYEFKDQLVLSLCLCNLLAYCDYEVFEEFYIQNIDEVIKGFDGTLEDKITRSILINRLFGNIKIDNVENLSCRITRAFCKKEPIGKELLRVCGGILFNACKESRQDSEDPETFRLYQCYAYNAAATLICNTKQNKPEWYRKFFMRTEKDQDILWTNLIPSHKTFNFCMVFEDIPKKKKVLSDIRTHNDSQIQPTEYIESQNLFLSTLAEDITNYDFTNVCVRQAEHAINNRGRKDNMYVEIDDEDVNQHECMLTVCSLVKHMFENDMLPEGAAPEWVHDIGSMLIKNNTPVNIRQFLCKMIENSQIYLKSYAGILIPGIIRVICDTCRGLNSLATDCIVMLLSTWKEHLPTVENTTLLVEFIMLNLWNDRTYVFNYNVNLLKATVETYRKIQLPLDFVYSLFPKEEQEEFLKTNMAVIHIINILLVNNISPFPLKLKEFFTRLCKLLDCNDKPIYTATAETLGLSLSFTEQANHSSFQSLKTKITGKIEMLLKDSSSIAKSEQVLESIVKNYPLICNYKILSSLERRMERKECIDTSQAGLLRIFLKCIKPVCELGIINKLPLTEWLLSTSVDIVIVTLEIILGGVNYFDISKAENLLDVVVNNANNNVICKIVKTDIFIAFYKRFCIYQDVKSRELISRMKEPLIRGFLDAEKDIRQKLYDFWTGLEIVPQHLEEKLLYILGNCYDNSNEDLFLAFSNILILHDLMDNDPIFNVPLHKCEYKDYEVNSLWKVKSVSMLPLFTASQSQQMDLKATQDYEFTQTQILTVQRQLFTQSASVLSLGKMQEVSGDAIFKNPNDLGIEISNSKVTKWRFYKDKAKISKMHAIRESQKGQDILKQKQEAKEMKEGHVKLYRKYRDGDFPDVQIRVQAVTDTLKELSKVDCLIAQLLYKNIFDSVVDVATSGEFLTQGCAAIEKIFTSSINFDPVCIGTFMQIALEHKDSMRFGPNLIKNVAIKSGNLFYGCLLLEENLNDDDQGNSDHMLHWIRLADLYKKLEEWDVVHGIFSNKIHSPTDLLLAIAAESENSWEIAKLRYSALIQNDNDPNRRDFYYEAYFKCSQELSDWKEIEKRCLETAKSEKNYILDALFSSEWNKEVLLPYYIKSQVRVGQNDFEVALKNAMRDAEKKEVFRNEMSDELSMFYLKTMKLKLARSYSENQATQFLKAWQCTNGTYERLRSEMLLEMKNCAEVSVLLDMYDEIKEANYTIIIDKIQQFWMKSTDKYKLIPTRHLTTTITMRDFFIDLAKLKLFTLNLETSEINAISKKLSEMSADANVNIVQEALQQKNFRLAKYFFAKLCTREDAITGLLFSKIVLRSLKDQTDLNILHKLFKEAFKGYNKCVTQLHFRSESTIAIDAALHLMELCKAVFRISQRVEMNLASFREFITCELSRFSDLLNYGFENLRDVLYRLDNPGIAARKQLADAFFTLSNEYIVRGQGFENRFIECTLKSMQYGSDKARMAFPRLLNVDGLVAVHKLQFIEQTSKIPTYMFISWIPQLLAHCDTVLVSVLKHIVLNLARKYPNSLIYAYKLSKKKYTYLHSETRELSFELDDLLHNDLVDKMLIALNYVVVPSTILRTAIDRLRKACSYSEEAFKQAGKEVTLLFGEEADPTVRGEQYEHVLKNKDALMNIIKHTPFNEGIITEKLKSFVIPSSKHSDDLGRYSPWLNYFHGSDFEKEIEVPGCYNGNSRPLPHYHPKILKYSTDVKVFHSLFKPIRITMFANDVKEYRFLVKYGEDLRQDQRIQQLFKLMNVALSEDVKCRERKLNVSVYEVIPLTGDLGFVQWVENTDMLRNFLINRSDYNGLNPKMFKCKVTHSKRPMGRSKEKVCSDFQQLVKCLPSDMLRKSLSNICPDLGTFFSLRMYFIRSYAVMCVTNWLLGIGDRHLENILLNTTTGHVFGIDFAHAFGSATLQQTIPELVPFRLTPQILNVMTPHQQNGLLQQTMVHVLRVLRENCDTLFHTLDIFVTEPTINWLSYKGQNTYLDILNLTKMKFQGHNSIRVMMEEIKLRPNKDLNEFYLQSLQEVLDTVHIGDEPEKLSVQEQVKRLIAHATDSSLLGMMYSGWEPWV